MFLYLFMLLAILPTVTFTAMEPVPPTVDPDVTHVVAHGVWLDGIPDGHMSVGFYRVLVQRLCGEPYHCETNAYIQWISSYNSNTWVIRHSRPIMEINGDSGWLIVDLSVNPDKSKGICFRLDLVSTKNDGRAFLAVHPRAGGEYAANLVVE
jgi:hypothetical protein